MDRWLPRKLTILGLSSILSIPAASLPPTIQASIPQLIDGMVRMSLALKDEAEKGETGAEGDGDGIGVRAFPLACSTYTRFCDRQPSRSK